MAREGGQDQVESSQMTAKVLKPETIRTRRRKIHERERAEQRNYEAALCDLKRELWELQKRCPHRDVMYYPDAAGGSDSAYICRDCEKEQRGAFGSAI